MVKGIVEMHGGTASVESDGAGRGTEFTVRLPLDLAGRAEAGRAIPLPVEERRQRVLIVEDNVDAAGTLRDVLELRGHTVAVAFSAADGMEKARAFTPDVVLCDIGLPGMSGYEVARAMRRDPALARTRLVALSGYAAPEDVARAREAGFDDHVAKPPSPERLEAILRAGERGGTA